MFGLIGAIAQDALKRLCGGVKDYAIQTQTKKQEEITKRLEIQEKTRQMEIEKEIAEKGLQESYNALQEQKEKTKQSEFATKQSEFALEQEKIKARVEQYKVFTDGVNMQTQYDYQRLTNEANDFLALFRPKFTQNVFERLISLFKMCLIFYAVCGVAYIIIYCVAKDVEFFKAFIDVGYDVKGAFIPVPKNLITAIISMPALFLYMLFEQWSYMQTYWFLARCEEKKNS